MTEISKRQMLYAAERNKLPIVSILKPRLELLRGKYASGDGFIKVLEVASGTGEHAALFMEEMDYILYQPTEMDVSMHDSITAWLQPFGSRSQNPISLDVNNHSQDLKAIKDDFLGKDQRVHVIVCINMIHISPWSSTLSLFELASKLLDKGGFLFTYGPYRVNGQMVASNVQFDESLKTRNSDWGVRDIEEVEKVANGVGMSILETIAMPANNLCLIFGWKTPK